MPGVGHRGGDGRGARGADHRRRAGLGARAPIAQVDGRTATARSTGVDELDRVLGGGLVPGAVVLLAGEPGVGKSTLLLDVAAKAASEAHRTLYVTGEESASQVRLRADRINALSDHLFLAAETDLSAVLGHLDAVQPSLLILDSVQTVASPRSTAHPAAWPRSARWPGR